jgi:hypothetical protein
MTAYGSRIPKGGRRGDTYRAYTHISADTDNDIHTLFDLAKASTGIPITNYYLSLFVATQTTDTIRAIVETVDPDAAKAMRTNTGLDPMGTTICNLYACHDYMSCGHWDLDGVPEKNQTKKKTKTDAPAKLSNCLGTCLQYTKNCRSDEFNFSYTEWGILVKTVPGCIW